MDFQLDALKRAIEDGAIELEERMEQIISRAALYTKEWYDQQREYVPPELLPAPPLSWDDQPQAIYPEDVR